MKLVRWRAATVVCVIAVLAAHATSAPSQAQDQPTSLGEVARRIREQRVLAQEVLCRWTDDVALTLSACRLGLLEEKKLAPAGRVLLGVLPLTTSPAAPIGPGMAAEPPPVTKLSQKENILQIART